MSEYGGLEPTGRELREPAATLIELTDEERIYTAVRFDEVYRGHRALTVGVELIRSFLQYPMVVGLPEMTHAESEAGVYVFETGPIWTLTEVLRRHRDIGQVCGVRAAFELAFLCTQILDEAGETGPREGCYSHGNLTPWRIALRADGSVQVFAYGLPPIDWICHKDDPDYVIDADTVRYAPPERLTIDAEDPAADTYGLMLAVWEMITGEPLVSGHDVAKIKKEIELATAQQTVLRAKVKGLTKKHLDLIARALIFDPDARLTGKDLIAELREVLNGKLAGDSLAEVMTRIRGKARKTPKGRKIESMQGTSVFTTAQLAELADQAEEEPEEAKEEKRWGTSRRRSKTAEPEPPEQEKKPARRRRRAAEDEPADEGQPNRRRRRAKKEEPAPAAEDKPTRSRRKAAKQESEEAEKPARRRRRAKEPEPEPEPSKEDKPRRRRRTKADDEPKEKPKEEPPARRRRRAASDVEVVETSPDASDEEKPAPRRRRRSASGAKPSQKPAVEAASAEKEPESQPARRRRRRTEPEEAETAAEAPAPKRRRRRRSESETDQTSEPPAEEEKPRRRRRRKTDE